MKNIIIITLLSLVLYGQDIELNKRDIKSVISQTTKNITAELIDNDSLSYFEAKKIFDDINLKFNEKKSVFKNKVLKLSIDTSFLNREIKEKKNEIVSIKSILKRKDAKLIQLETDIQSEKQYIKDLQNLAHKKIEFNSNISTQGYFITFVENRRSVSRDKFIEIATKEINNESIQQLNGVLVKSIAKIDKELSMEIRETSSGTAITDSSDTTIKIFFANGRRNSTLIYGTKVDVYPFESGEIIIRKQRQESKVKFILLIQNQYDIKDAISTIQAEYPKVVIPTDLKSKMIKALDSLNSHNIKSENAILEIDKNHQRFVKKMRKRVQARSKVVKLLDRHKIMLLEDISELNFDIAVLKKETEILEDKFTLVQNEIIEVKRAITFTRAEMYDRKHSNAVLETKNIVKELLKDIDKSILKTSKKMETIFNGSQIIKDIVDEVEYEKIYLKSKIIPYFVDNTNRTGALVTLEIQFKDKKLAKVKNIRRIELVLISKGDFKFGSNFGDSDEKPVRYLKIKKDFLIGKYEITVGEYMEFAKATKSHFPEWYQNNNRKYQNKCLKNNCPIIGVSWLDAQAYTKWLSKRDNKVYRLPTEMEWEYVAKTDLNLDFGYLYGKLQSYSWFAENSNWKTHRVGLKKPNLFGVYDMHGNVWELCQNSYHKNYLNKREDLYKVMRGGDWRTKKYYLRSSNRAKYRNNNRGNSVGFRIIQEIENY